MPDVPHLRLSVEDLAGLWRRSLIAWPDGREDRTTFVAWLQGTSYFADLRQPFDPPSFESVTCLDDLRRDHFAWLARQEGFAGRFVAAGDAFEWQRAIDFQCPTAFADAGYLSFEDGVLVERGRDLPYVEHWHRSAQCLTIKISLRLQSEEGRGGFLVRVGEDFMYARDRSLRLPPGGALADLVQDAADEEARTLLDCEISLGSVDGDVWKIGRSTIPFRVGKDLSPKLSNDRKSLAVSDVARDGAPLHRRWTILDVDTTEASFGTLIGA